MLCSLLVQSLGRLVGPLRHWSHSGFDMLKRRFSIVDEVLRLHLVVATLLVLSHGYRAFVIGGEDLGVRAGCRTEARR